jgi:hypothetical protein
MRRLDVIQKYVNPESQKVLTDDARMMSELLWEIVQRLDAMMRVDLSNIEVLDYCLRVNITPAGVLIYQNNTSGFVTLKLYNTDPAQTVFIGKNNVTITGPGIPLFHETDMRVTVAAGDSLWGIVDLGTVDVRYSVNMMQ